MDIFTKHSVLIYEFPAEKLTVLSEAKNIFY